ncbi:hypothetical protein CCHR01_02621 [Colletotrichum chrysophilum]|uniref:Uncharacterized protein n=1 Tax=Colletotrichum chrysophilum TaxID=1836956 RepID=A0AAD9AXX2_9PEZI|nr:hypothetical protein CCHR01_02621 [Colletotrichum chrysophilum]
MPAESRELHRPASDCPRCSVTAQRTRAQQTTTHSTASKLELRGTFLQPSEEESSVFFRRFLTHCGFAPASLPSSCLPSDDDTTTLRRCRVGDQTRLEAGSIAVRVYEYTIKQSQRQAEIYPAISKSPSLRLTSPINNVSIPSFRSSPDRSALDPNLFETIACGPPDWRHHTGAPAREEAGESWWGSSRSQATLPTAKSARILACFWVDAHGSIKQQIRDEHEASSLQFLEAVMPAHYHQQSNPPQRAQLSSLATNTLGLACPNLATNCYFIKGLPHTVMKKAPNGSRKRKMYRGSSEPLGRLHGAPPDMDGDGLALALESEPVPPATSLDTRAGAARPVPEGQDCYALLYRHQGPPPGAQLLQWCLDLLLTHASLAHSRSPLEWSSAEMGLEGRVFARALLVASFLPCPDRTLKSDLTGGIM